MPVDPCNHPSQALLGVLRDPRRAGFPSRLSFLKAVLSPPPYQGAKLTLKRLVNLYRGRFEAQRLRPVLRSLPIKLTLEPTNFCNLRCPACFTGTGELGREQGPMPLSLYEKLLEELGDTLLQIEFTTWGEPLLAKLAPEMFQAASRRGISTVVSSNLSFKLPEERAEAIVRSGLHVLGVSIDGATQETYEKYRVGGRLERVLANCRLIRETKARLNSPTPSLVWEYHVFPHNEHELDLARRMAAELDMEISVDKAWVIGSDWTPTSGAVPFIGEPQPMPCLFLWERAVVNNDGGLSPCCGSFYAEDDMGRIAAEPGDLEASTFREVWNGPRFRSARRFYSTRHASSEEKESICYDCPSTHNWHAWMKHFSQGGTLDSFKNTFSYNDGFNYFWSRRPTSRSVPERPPQRSQEPSRDRGSDLTE